MACGHCGMNTIRETIQKEPYLAKHICGCGVKMVIEREDGSLKAELLTHEIPEEYKDKLKLIISQSGLSRCPLKTREECIRDKVCITCGEPVTKENVAIHIFGDCEGMFCDGSENVNTLDSNVGD